MHLSHRTAEGVAYLGVADLHRNTEGYRVAKLGAGGWVTAVRISPDGLTRLARTDVGGGWRWDTDADRWEQIITRDGVEGWAAEATTLEGVHEVAANDTYALMAYRNAIYKSTDRGHTWSLSLENGPVTAPNGGTQRWLNDHMAFDPNDDDVCLYGTYQNGLYFTTDAGATWNAVSTAAVPAGTATWGIPCVTVDTAGNWYAAPYGSGVYRSTDQGGTWAKISSDSDFIVVTGMQAAPNGDVLVTAHTTTALNGSTSRVFRYRSGTWTNVTPSGSLQIWRTLAFDPHNPGRVLLQNQGGSNERISADYGDTWAPLTTTFTADDDVHWLAAANSGYYTQGGLQFDPVVPGRVWMSEGIGVWFADLGASPTTITWQAQARGIEELVVNHVLAPPGGRPVVSCWDRAIFLLNENGEDYPTHYHPQNGVFLSGWGADYAADDPAFIAAVLGNHQPPGNPAPTGYSEDGGHTWVAFPTIPLNSVASNTFGYGSIHVGGREAIIWASANSKGAYRTTDLGETWVKIAISGVTDTAINARTHAVRRRPFATEKTPGHAGTFYLFTNGAGFFRSTDGGVTWEQRAPASAFTALGDISWNVHVQTVPGHPGHLFLTPGRTGGYGTYPYGTPFFRSTDGGATWAAVPQVKTVAAFDFGKASPGSDYPAIYAVGYLQAVHGCHRSIDGGDTWETLSTHPGGLTAWFPTVAASKEVYGLHWLGTDRVGVLRGHYV